MRVPGTIYRRIGAVQAPDREDWYPAYWFSGRTRYKASAIHFLLTVTIFVTFLAIAFLVWYPWPYFETENAPKVLRILVGVDVVLGPLLTLIIFKPGKPGLKFDLAMIAMVQFAALAYGASVLFEGRPGYIAFAVDRFTVIPALDIDDTNLRYPELRTGILSRPNLVYVQQPADPEERSRLLEEFFQGGPDLDARPEYYEPYAEHTRAVLKRAHLVAGLYGNSNDRRAVVEQFARKRDLKLDEIRYLPLVGKDRDMAMIVENESGAVIGAIDLDPWQVYRAATPSAQDS